MKEEHCPKDTADVRVKSTGERRRVEGGRLVVRLGVTADRPCGGS